MQTTEEVRDMVNLSKEALVNLAIERGEGVLSANGAVAVTTGRRTGRSPNDKFIVKDDVTRDTVDWGKVNQPIAAEKFQAIWDLANQYLASQSPLTSFLQVGADEKFHIPVKMITETAAHHLFGQHMFIRERMEGTSINKEWTIVNVPGFATDPARDGVKSEASVLLDMTNRRVLICGMLYAGEMKKAMFTVMNFVLPAYDVLPMHCGANQGEEGDTALFFGLSGTGKTTLSADPARYLIGDDEHGWGPDGIFNFEGGCYAKCINLSQKNEPVIWNAIRDGALMENLVLDDQGYPKFDDVSLTKNTRAAYPLEHVEKRVKENKGAHPAAVVFLSCDLYGVLPPVALLNKEQAAYYFLSGYTALVGSTEVGSSAEIQTTFSACFGAPFFPRPAHVYAELLMKRIEETGAQAYLVNTGWTGGGYGKGGSRFEIATTRAVVTAIVNGDLKDAASQTVDGFNFAIPSEIAGVDQHLINPRDTWEDAAAYEAQKQVLIKQFVDNFERRFTDEADAIRNAGPVLS